MSKLDPEIWARLDEVLTILDRLFELPAAEREGSLERIARADPELAAGVRELLRADDRGCGLLDQPLEDAAGPLFADAIAGDDSLPAGSSVAAYRIVSEIGRGGMGRVYLAARADGHFEQRVALKLLPPGAVWGALEGRFLQERQILASLEHPGIARLLDGGIAQDGRPFFAMEYVDGRPITRYAEEERLGTDDRLVLFADVCAAVAYAQQRLIVHRDLKPSNILVTAGRQVKLLDFGIAKLLGTSEESLATRAGVRLLTPEYAAPEQIHGGPITTATDVWALGCVLGELLTGERPAAGAAAKLPGLRGDLASIVAVALSEEPERRYPSAAALGEDLRRYRQRLPVEARRPSLGYRARRFAVRHRLAVAAASTLALSLFAGLVLTTWQARRAERQARRATEVTEFLVSLFEAADPDLEQGSDTPASEILARGSARIEQELAGDPELQAELHDVVGRIQMKRGAYQESARHHERALGLRTELYGDRDPRVGASLAGLGEARLWQSEYQEAESLLSRALALERERSGTASRELGRALGNLATAKNRLGSAGEAEALHREALEVDREALGDRHLDVASDLGSLAVVLSQQGRYDEAEALHLEALGILRQHLPERHSSIALALHNLGHLHLDRRDYAAAEPHLREAVEMRRHLYRGPHPRLASSLRVLGMVLEQLGRGEEAHRLFEESLAMSRASLGDLHADVASVVNDLAVNAFLRGDLTRARERFAEALAIFRQLLPERHPTLLTLEQNLGRIALDLGDLDEAGEVFAAVLNARREALGDEHPAVADDWIGVGIVHLRRGQWAEARAAFASAVAIRRALHGGEGVALAIAESFLARALGELGHLDEAEALLREALAVYEAELPPGNQRTADASLELGRLLVRTGRAAEALALLEEAERWRRETYGGRDGRTGEAIAALAIGLRAVGREAEAEGLLEEAVAVLTLARGAADLETRRARDALARMSPP